MDDNPFQTNNRPQIEIVVLVCSMIELLKHSTFERTRNIQNCNLYYFIALGPRFHFV